MEDPIFTNEQLISTSLPKVEAISFERLQAGLKWSHLLMNSIISILLFLILAVLYYNGILSPFYLKLIIVLIMLLSGIMLLYPMLAYPKKGFAIRQHDIIYKEGVWFQSIMIVPFNRVQHIEVNQGPIDRIFRLYTLNIFTAGGSQSDLVIDGLEKEAAMSMKQFILSKKQYRDEEE